MKIIILILLILGCAQLNNCQEVPDDGILFQTFLNWMDNYGVYYTSGDMQSKFQTWKANLLDVAAKNAQTNNVPDVVFTVQEQPVAAMRTLLEAEPVVVESYPGQDALKFELNEFSDLSQAEFQSIYTGADISLMTPVAAAAVLSTGAIVGIAVGGAALAGGAAATVFIVKKKRSKKEQKQQKPAEQDVKMTNNKPTNGIDLLGRTENPHHSITARALY